MRGPVVGQERHESAGLDVRVESHAASIATPSPSRASMSVASLWLIDARPRTVVCRLRPFRVKRHSVFAPGEAWTKHS